MKLNEKAIEVIARTTIEYLEEERKKQEKIKHDRRLRNIKLLLRNYRAFVNHCEDIKLEINQLNKKLELDEIDTDEFAIRSILNSKERTLAMVKYINKTLEVYRILCEKSDDPEELRRYRIIYGLYISDEKKTAKDLAEGHSVHPRTIYKDIDRACETLVVLMFGVDGLKLK